MKKLIALLLAALLLLSLAACGEKEPEAPAIPEPVVTKEPEAPVPEEPELPEEPEEEPVEEKVYPVKEFDAFSLEYEDVLLTPGADYPESLFEETAPAETTPDCRTDGMAVVYTYAGFQLQTAILTDQEAGRESVPFISNLTLKDDSLKTPEGIGLGSTVEELLEAYGGGYTEEFGAYVYAAGETQLYAYPDADGEKLKYLVISLSEDVLAVRAEEFVAQSSAEAPQAVPAAGGDAAVSEDYPGISYEGLKTRIFASYAEYKEGVDSVLDGVKAYDENGNELEVTYELYTDNLIDNYKWGPGLVVLYATDAQGHTARQWQSFLIEEYGEEDEAIIARFAEETSDDLFEIKNYVRHAFKYSAQYRGLNTVSLTMRYMSGNCYSSARILQALLEYKGYHAIIIWSNSSLHNWVLVETEDGWRHIDGIPSIKYSDDEGIMTDEERMAIHGNRPWNTAIFPAAN